MTYQFKTAPFPHQRNEVENNWRAETRALFWEQGTGKSKAVIDTAAALFRDRRIDALIVIAPNGVQHNWATDELPEHCAVPYLTHPWATKSVKTKWHARSLQDLLKYRSGLAILLLSYDGFMTTAGRKFAGQFARERNAMCVLDESQRIKTPSAKRTQALARYGKHFARKRILTGTPVTNSPFDVYSQLKFLDWDFWKREGFADYQSFKTYFGIWEERVAYLPADEDGNRKESHRFKALVTYKNIDKLHDIVRRVSSRVLKSQVLDLPDKLYTKRYFEPSAEQARLYKQLKEEFLIELESGELLTAPLLIVRLLRFQQMLSGYLPSDDGEVLQPLSENPRLTLLLDTLQDVDGKALIFARFKQDINLIMAELGDRAVRYDGEVEDDERIAARKAFQDPDSPVRFFVGNPAACGSGLTLTAAGTVIYYSNSFNLEQRLQSEDRAHRIGQKKPVRYIDLVARGTIDTHIVKSLREKRNIASQITGDELKAWL